MWSSDEKTWGMLSHLITLVVNYLLGGLGWVVGLIIFFIKSKDSKFVAFHALQASLFQLAIAFLVWLCVCTFFLVVPLILAVIFGLMGIIYPIIGMIKASNGELWEYPFVGKFCRRQVGL